MSIFYILIMLLILVLVLLYQSYFDRVVAKRIIANRKEEIYELLKKEYKDLQENELGFLEYKFDSRIIMFEYYCVRTRNGFNNHLKIYLDIDYFVKWLPNQNIQKEKKRQESYLLGSGLVKK